MGTDSNPEYEYVVVGSGAGGGTVAARLAEQGCKVLLLEAGGDPEHLKGGGPAGPQDGNDKPENRMPDDFNVPVFHPMAVENEAMSWEFFVRHYQDNNRQKKDEKYQEEKGGVFYPRAGTLGGCTAHHAMVTVYPHNDDWDYVAYLTGDSSWKAENMRKYWERLERCRHRFSFYRWLSKIGFNFTRHGWNGWLQTEFPIPLSALGDWKLLKTLMKSAFKAFCKVGRPFRQIYWLIQGFGDPNDWRLVQKNSEGIRYAPQTIKKGSRAGTRERLIEVKEKHPDNLNFELNALATKVLFDDENRAIGVEYLKGKRLYQAHPQPSKEPGEKKTVRVSREVILAGGAFNTPQLLMLSGIGPSDELKKHGIEVRIDLPGVGRNLQDRYEVVVINRMNSDWKLLKDAEYFKTDSLYKQWEQSKRGVYSGNGSILAVIKKSDPKRLLPDLFCFAVLAKFKGYFQGFSKDILKRNYLTWLILKGHTNNTAGRVTLRSNNPLERPDINFKYFDEGNDKKGEDLTAVVEGIKFVRSMTEKISDIVVEEELPGNKIQSDRELAEYVKNNAWGHHASCTCPIGPQERNGVLNGDFEVHGTKNLRVVDASVFPKIPGFFIFSSIYMIGEKAADVILEKAGKPLPSKGKPKGLLKLLGQGVLVLLLILVLIVGSSWFYFEPNSKPQDETQTINDIILLLQDNVSHTYTPKFFRRDTHPKANACVKAKFTVVADDPLKIGVFSKKDHTYNAWLRFSNAAEVVTPDMKPDFRGLAIKLFDVEGKRVKIPGGEQPNEKKTQDFLFIAHNVFFAGNAQHFHDFFSACRRGGYSCEPSLTNLPLLWHLLTHPRGAYNALMGRKTYGTIQDIFWFSVAPFKFGNDKIVKYGVFPPEGEQRGEDVGISPYYLTNRLKKTLDLESGKGFKLDFNIQFQNRPENQPIENTLIAWDAKDSPWQRVATIEIFPQEFDVQGQGAFCENITYNPWHSLEDHRPIGGINEARRNVMHSLQSFRLRENGRQRIEPTGNESFPNLRAQGEGRP